MLKNLNLRATLLFVHGALALNLGLILFYLHAIMTNVLFEAIAIASAVVFAGTALLLAAIADWVAAALSTAGRRMHQAWLYSLSGFAAFVVVAVVFAKAETALYLLLMLAALHAAFTGAYALALAVRMHHPGIERGMLFALGSASVTMAGLIAMFGWRFSDRTATAWLGACLCLAGAKTLFFSEMMGNRKTAAS
jgi:uncharacterized membrane protein HdeD (DUF308 family)